VTARLVGGWEEARLPFLVARSVIGPMTRKPGQVGPTEACVTKRYKTATLTVINGVDIFGRIAASSPLERPLYNYDFERTLQGCRAAQVKPADNVRTRPLYYMGLAMRRSRIDPCRQSTIQTMQSSGLNSWESAAVMCVLAFQINLPGWSATKSCVGSFLEPRRRQWKPSLAHEGTCDGP
jgi:hypothetical protein